MKSNLLVMSTKQVLLRQITVNDLENIYKGLSNPQVIKYYGVSFDSLEATQKQMLWFENLKQTETGVWWAVCSPDNKVFYGAAGLNNVLKEHKNGEIGFWLLPEFWRKGIMTEVVPLICSYGFDKLRLHRIEAFVESENQNSKKTLTKIGFEYEGTMKDCEIKNGKFISLDMYALIKNNQNEY